MSLLQDIRYGARMLASKPGVTAAAVLSLALGVGTNSAVFSLIDALMLKGLPGVESPQELVILGDGRSRGINSSSGPVVRLFSYPRYERLRDSASDVATVAGFCSMDVTVYLRRGDQETPTPAEARMVTGEYFTTLGVRAARGRLLTPADDAVTGGRPLAVLDYGFWQETMGGDESLIGSAITLNDRAFTIVGVAPPSFAGERMGERPDLYTPTRMQAEILRMDSFLDEPSVSFLQLMARLQPGVSQEQAEAALATRWRAQLDAEGGDNPSEEWVRATERAALTLQAGGNGYSSMRDLGDTLYLLLGVTALVLLIACANVANLMLARGASRARELGVRVALGADRGRLIRQMLTECLLLAGLAAATAFAVAAWSRDVLLAMAGSSAEEFGLNAAIDWRVAGFTGLVALGSGLLFGMIPAWRAGRTEVASAMRAARGAAGGRSRVQSALVVGQAALSLVLLFGTGLFIESLSKLAKADVGVFRESLLSIEIDPQGAGLDDTEMPALGRRLVESVEATPGVQSATMTLTPIAMPGNHTRSVGIEGMAEEPGESFNARLMLVSPGYFETTGTALLAGRPIGPEDAEGSTPAAVVDQTFVDRYLSGSDPLSHAIEFDDDIGFVPIVGVAAETRLNSVRSDPMPTMYVSGYAYPWHWRAMAVRVQGDAAAVVPALRRAIAQAEPRLPIKSVATVDQRLADQNRGDRMLLQLISGFGVLALLLASIGLYGVLSYRVAGRTSEIGVRMAIGAERKDVLGLVLREGLVLVAIGVAAGLLIAPAAAQAVRAALYQPAGWNFEALALAAVTLFLVAAAAALAPSLRAARLSPVVALREE